MRRVLILALMLSPGAVRAQTPGCPPDRIDERVMVARVFDGDTLALADGRRVRLLGINTPEIGRDGAPSEPFAEDARRLLAEMAGPGAALLLRTDVEQRDRYGRLLAHGFSADGANVQAHLLDAGLATTLVVPPNQWRAPCYARLEADARSRGAGVWSLEAYRPTPAEGLPDTARGFRLVIGRVQRIGESRGNLWLNLAPRMAVRIPREDLVYFGDLDPRGLAGRLLEVRGWLQRRRGELRITVRHPAALVVLD